MTCKRKVNVNARWFNCPAGTHRVTPGNQQESLVVRPIATFALGLLLCPFVVSAAIAEPAMGHHGSGPIFHPLVAQTPRIGTGIPRPPITGSASMRELRADARIERQILRYEFTRDGRAPFIPRRGLGETVDPNSIRIGGPPQ
jgi:hypothetical protein